MNRIEKAYVWIFGLIIAHSQWAAGHFIWALVVVAGLIILTLRDDQEKEQEITPEAVPPTPSQPVPEPSRRDATPDLPAVMRYPQRKESDFIFPVRECQPTEETICEARAKDKADLQSLQRDIAGLFEKAECLHDQQTFGAGVMMDFLQYEVSPLKQRAAAIGEPAFREFKALEHIEDGLMKALLKVCSEGARSTTAA